MTIARRAGATLIAMVAVTLTIVGGAQSPASSPQTPPRDQPAERTGTGIIRGLVATADTRWPLKRAEVRLTSAGLREARVTATDGDGKYEFSDLPAGQYSLMAGKLAYLTASYGQRTTLELGTPIDLVDGQTIDNANLFLHRGGVISGRVTDASGEAIAGVEIEVAQAGSVLTGRILFPGGRGVTNDLGEYRAYALPPGEYVVTATFRPRPAPGEPGDTTTYAATYYPGTLVQSDARKIVVEVGAEVPNIAFALIRTRAATVSGTATDSAGKPLANAMVYLQQGVSGPNFSRMTSGGNARVMSDGTFTLPNVKPGEYTLSARSPELTQANEYAFLNVTVTGDDVGDVALVASRGATARGRVVIDADAPADLRVETLRISGTVTVPTTVLGSQGSGTVNGDGAFEVHGIFGTVTLRVNELRWPWHVKAVTRNGIDITDRGFPFKGTEDVTGFEIVVTDRTNRVQGTVLDEAGQPTRDATVVFFPTDRAKWPYPRHIHNARPDQTGRFIFSNIDPAEYYAIAARSIEPRRVADPAFLDELQRSAQRITLTPGMPPIVLKLATP